MSIARQIIAHGEVEMLRDPWLATRTPALIGTDLAQLGGWRSRVVPSGLLHAYE